MNEKTTAGPGPARATIMGCATLFSLTRHTWTNRIKADKSRILTSADKDQFNLSKRLLKSKELDALNKFMGEAYDWCFDRAMPSATIRKGIYFVRSTLVPDFEEHLLAARTALRRKYVPEFLATYASCKERMKAPEALGDLYCESDYPKPADIAQRFDLRWSWLSLSVPTELPDDVRQREVAKLHDSFAQAQAEIRYALRAGFKSLVDHATERLTVKAGERPKAFKDTFVSNFQHFFDTFGARNLMDDAALAALVSQAKGVVAGLPDLGTLRSDAGVRAEVAESFARLNQAVGDLVVDKPARAFDLEDDS